MANKALRHPRASLHVVDGLSLVNQMISCSAHLHDAIFFIPGPEHPANPYSMMQTSDRTCRRREHWMLYPGGFLHVMLDGTVERLNPYDWVRDARVFSRLIRIEFFQTMRLRKAFSIWLRKARANAFNRNRLHVSRAMRFQKPYLAFLTKGLCEFRFAMDSMNPIPDDLDTGIFQADTLRDLVRNLTDRSTRRAYAGVHSVLDRVHLLCFQLFDNLTKGWRQLRSVRCPSTFDSPVLGTSRARVAQLRSNLEYHQRVETMLPLFIRVVFILIQQHTEERMSEMLEPFSRRLECQELPLIEVQLKIAEPSRTHTERRDAIDAEIARDTCGGDDDGRRDCSVADDSSSGQGDGSAGVVNPSSLSKIISILATSRAETPHSPQLRVEPNRAFVEARLREVARLISFSVRTGAEQAMKPLLESWARRQPPSFDSQNAPERVLANEIRFLHLLRDDQWSGITHNTRLCTHVSALMVSNFGRLNSFIEKHEWILVLYKHCRTNEMLLKPSERLADVISELTQLLDWEQLVRQLPDSFSTQLFRLDVIEVRVKLDHLINQRADFLVDFLLSSIGSVKEQMKEMMAEIPRSFNDGDNTKLSLWFYRVSELIRYPYQKFDVVGTTNRFLALMADAGWEQNESKFHLFEQVLKTTEELNIEWTAYIDKIYSCHRELLEDLSQRRAVAHDQHSKALLAVEKVHQEINSLPRWPGDSDVIMKALIPGFDGIMEGVLTARIQELFKDIDRLAVLQLKLGTTMSEVMEAERVIRILFQKGLQTQHIYKSSHRIRLKMRVWMHLRDLLAITQSWLHTMNDRELRRMLTTELDTWTEERRRFQSDIGTERQSIRFWRDRMEEVRRLVVMMEAVQGDGSQGSDWSPIVGKMRSILVEKEDDKVVDGTVTKDQKPEQKLETTVKGIEKGTEQDTLTKHVSVIYAQVSQKQRSFSARELVDSMNLKLGKLEFTMERYIPRFIMDQGVIMDEVVYTVRDGIGLETEVMFNVSALRALTEWNVTNNWWRQVLATNENWERAALVVRYLVSVQRDWVQLFHLVNVGAAPQLPSLQRVTSDYCQLTRDLQQQPRLAAHDFSRLLIRLRGMNRLLTEYLFSAGSELEKTVRYRHEDGWSNIERVPKILDADMERQIRIRAEDEGLFLHDGQIKSLITIHQALTAQRMVIVAGEPATGKSTMIKLLLTAKQAILGGGVDDMYSSKNISRVMDRIVVGPRSIHHLVSATRMMGTLPNVEEWLVLDHDWPMLDDLAHNMTPVVSRNSNLLLVLETSNLDTLGPAELHIPIVSLAQHKLSWRMLVRAWLSRVAKTALFRLEIGILEKLIESLFPATITFLSEHHTTLTRESTNDQLVSGYLGCHHVTMFRQLFTALMSGYDALLIRHGDASLVVHRVTALAYIWAFGGALEKRHRAAFDLEARRLMTKAGGIDFPDDGTVYDLALDLHVHWCGWRAVTGDNISSTGRRWHVNVPQQASVAHLAVTLLRHDFNVIMYAPRGSGKTQVLQHLVAPKFHSVPLDHAPYAPAEAARVHLAMLCRKITNSVPKPAIVIDDLHFATKDDPGGLQHLVREHVHLQGFRSGEDFEFHSNGVLPVFATAIDIPSAVRGLTQGKTVVKVNERLKHHSFILALPKPGADLIAAVFSPVIRRSVFKYLPADCKKSCRLFTDTWMDATCHLYSWLGMTLRANAVLPGRMFNLHHVSRCTALAVESACRLLERSDITGTEQQRVEYILPEVWLYAAENVFEQRLECPKDINRFAEKALAITVKLRERFEEEEIELEWEENKNEEMRNVESRRKGPRKKKRPVSTKFPPPLTESRSQSRSSKGRRKRSKRSRSSRKNKSRSSSGSATSKISKLRTSSSQKQRSNQIASKLSTASLSVMGSTPAHDAESAGHKSVQSIIGEPSAPTKKQSAYHHFRKDTFISERRRKIIESEYGKQVYVKPKSRWVQLSNRILREADERGAASDRRGKFLSHKFVHDKDTTTTIAESIASNEPDLRLILASSVIVHGIQCQDTVGVHVSGTGSFDTLLNGIIDTFTAKHPGRLPSVLPSAMTNVLLTLVQSLSTSSRCTTILRVKGAPGMRTLIQLACTVVQFKFMDLRRHTILDDDVIPELCRCVLRALFEKCNQCLYVTDASHALELVHAVVTSRLPLQVVYSEVWYREADKMGHTHQLTYLEEQGMLLEVAGSCISRHLHVAVSCTLAADEERRHHFQAFRMQSLWPSFFNHVVVSLPEWPADNYVCLARRYMQTIDARLDSQFVCDALVKLHMNTFGSILPSINPLSLLYQLCDSFAICHSEISESILPCMEHLIVHLKGLHGAKRAAEQSADEMIKITEKLEDVQSDYQAAKKRCAETSAKIKELHGGIVQISEEQVKTAYELHVKNASMDKMKHSVAKLRVTMAMNTQEVDFYEAVQKMHVFIEPPQPLRLLASCICVLFDKPDVWEEAKKLLMVEGFHRILELVTFDIITEEHMEALQRLLPEGCYENASEELNDAYPSAVPLLKWLHEMSECAKIHLLFMHSVAESTKLSEKFADLQTSKDTARQHIANQKQEHNVAVQRRDIAAEELHSWRGHQIHAVRRREWLTKIADAVWRETTGPDGSRAFGHRLCDQFMQLYKALCHLPASAAILAAASTYSGWSTTYDKPHLQLWLQTLICRHNGDQCHCPQVDLQLPSSVLDKLDELPNRIRLEVQAYSKEIRPHPLQDNTMDFLRETMLPSWFSPAELAHYQRKRTYGGEHALFLRILLWLALRRHSCSFVVISDPENKLLQFLEDFSISMPSVVENELQMTDDPQTKTFDSEESRSGTDIQTRQSVANAGGPEEASTVTEPVEKKHPSGLLVKSCDLGDTLPDEQKFMNLNRRTASGLALVKKLQDDGLNGACYVRHSESSIFKLIQPQHYSDITRIAIETPETADILLLINYARMKNQRLLIHTCSDASVIANKLLGKHRGEQHLVTHINLALPPEACKERVNCEVFRRLRTQVHRDECTTLDDLCYWLGRRQTAENNLLEEVPQLLALLQDLQPPQQRPVAKLVPHTEIPDSVPVVVETRPYSARSPNHKTRRSTIPLPAIRITQGVQSSATRLSLAATQDGSENTASLMERLDSRRRNTHASLSLAKSWRSKINRQLRPMLSRSVGASSSDKLMGSEAVTEENEPDESTLLLLERRAQDLIKTGNKLGLTESAISYTALGRLDRQTDEGLTDAAGKQPGTSGKVHFALTNNLMEKSKATRRHGVSYGFTTENETSEIAAIMAAKRITPKTRSTTNLSNNPPQKKASITKRPSKSGSIHSQTLQAARKSVDEEHRRQNGSAHFSPAPKYISNPTESSGQRKASSLSRKQRLSPASWRRPSSHVSGRGRSRSTSSRRRSSRRKSRHLRRRTRSEADADGPHLKRRQPGRLKSLNTAEIARFLLLSLQARQSSFQALITDVDATDAGIKNSEQMLVDLVEQKAPLAAVTDFFAGLYTPISALRLQSNNLRLEIFAGWLSVALRVRTETKIEDKKSADYFKLLSCADIMPRILEQIPQSHRFWYLLLAALAAAGWADASRIRLLVRGPPHSDGWMENWLPACPGWIAEHDWLSLGALGCYLPGIGRLMDGLREGQDIGWKERLEAGPDILDRNDLGAVEWALVWRVLKPDTVLHVAKQLINCALGPITSELYDTMPSMEDGPRQLVKCLGDCVPAHPYQGMPLRLMEKLYAYISELLSILRKETPLEADASTMRDDEGEQCPWSRYLASEARAVRSHLRRMHNDLSEVRRMLMARLSPTDQLEQLVTSLSERAVPSRWLPPEDAPSQHVARLMRHLFGCLRNVQSLAAHTDGQGDLVTSPLPIQLTQFFNRFNCIPSLCAAAAHRLRVGSDNVAITVIDDVHPEPRCAVRIQFDTTSLTRRLRQHMMDVCIGWRRRPRTDQILLVVCGVEEITCRPMRPHVEENPENPIHLMDPTMMKYISKMRESLKDQK